MAVDLFPILLVEDNEHDVRFFQRAWRQNSIANPLYVVSNGQACLDFLRHKAVHTSAVEFPRPGLVLMDIRMPVMGGLECLKAIRADPELVVIPVIIFTTSLQYEDRVLSYKFGCNGFIEKPLNFESLSKAVATIHRYWSLCTLP